MIRSSRCTYNPPLMDTQSFASNTPSLFEWRDGFKILIVDDNVPAADSLTKLLNRVGMIAHCVYSAAAALQEDARTYDVIMLDIGMPEMNGYELVRELRERGISIPIVALTGFGLEEDKRRAHEAGFTAHLTKPVGLKEIRELLSRIA